MKRALIIGGAGFVGNYLARQLVDIDGYETAVTKMPQEVCQIPGVEVFDLNILEKQAIYALLKDYRPDYIFHLAAQSSVFVSWKNPELTIDVNIKGSVNVLDAVRMLDYQPRILLIGSGEEYGHVLPDEIPIDEDNRVRPGNIYAATKVCQNLIGKIYSQAYNMDIMSVRAFNHIGPNQSPMFVVADFCKQVAEIEAGKSEPVIYVGNLSAKRDFTDVRDVVKAYSLLIKHGKKGETYNVGSGKAVSIENILDAILILSSEKIAVKQDPAKMRPVDVPIIEADVTKLVECTGWKRKIPLSCTLEETVDYWRNRLRSEE